MGSYNVKVYHYLNETQIRIYEKPINNSFDLEDYEKEIYKNEKEKMKENKEKLNIDFDDKDLSLNNSQNRSINRIYELSRSNEWEFFITLTLDPKKVDRFDYDDVCKNLYLWLQNMKVNYAPDLKYLIVPEKHKNGAFHFHGLISNIGRIKMVDSGHKDPSGDPIYNIDNYKLGFTSATKVKDNNKVSSYISKYITKELCITTKGKKRYWSSRNLNEPMIESLMLTPAEKDKLIEDIKYRIKYSKGKKCGLYENNVLYIELKNL